MSKEFLKAVKNRRSIYGISKESTISNQRIKEIIEHTVKYAPSAMNSQSARIVVLFGKHHDRLWDITMEALRKIVPANQFSDTENKINSFKSGYGTILFYEDQSVIESLQEQFALYKDNFPKWSQQSSGMHQLIVWTALEAEGLGASLQHYNELIETEVRNEWNIPGNWQLIAQMPFGKPTAAPGEKEFKSLEERIKFFE
ncbi:nitroreductase [Defluviitalea raffinosedens]|uniref:Nitroreductase n=1 Tax=Defluviitalea raffinosedens TaxID=1450156 RepID=A0A7C8LEJ9_9FIRM|nr:nitroreductase family protein [Defluviitalea raffinosedens]KAE9634117.1 nitroreductase [Defluviitalea raffinosedens]